MIGGFPVWHAAPVFSEPSSDVVADR
jgi:hypothetical protein